MRPLVTLRDVIERLRRDEQAADGMHLPYVPAALPRTAAELRAKRLLLRMLSPTQRDELARYGYFTVRVANRGSFRILPGTMFNVFDPRSGLCYCAGPEGLVPLADWMLAQKLILENDPEQFFRVARCRRG